MICTDLVKIAQCFDICENEIEIEGELCTSYGIILSQITGGKSITVAKVMNVCEDKEVIYSLIEQLQDEDVDPMTLQYIVEDFVAQMQSYND